VSKHKCVACVCVCVQCVCLCVHVFMCTCVLCLCVYGFITTVEQSSDTRIGFYAQKKTMAHFAECVSYVSHSVGCLVS
jgi:hypothetical protein